MSVTDKDIFAAAQVLIDTHGDEALGKAMEKLSYFEQRGETGPRECWNKIARAVQWLEGENAEVGESLQ